VRAGPIVDCAEHVISAAVFFMMGNGRAFYPSPEVTHRTDPGAALSQLTLFPPSIQLIDCRDRRQSYPTGPFREDGAAETSANAWMARSDSDVRGGSFRSRQMPSSEYQPGTITAVSLHQSRDNRKAMLRNTTSQ